MSHWPQFAFIDESGVLTNDPAQRFFALGMLMIENPARLHESLVRLHGLTIGSLNVKRDRALPRLKPRDFEFKFANITGGHVRFYQRLIDLCLAEPGIRCRICHLDKTQASFTSAKNANEMWDAYLNHTATLMESGLELGDRAIVIADYLSKPSAHPIYIEQKLRGNIQVLNATTLESDASLFIQAIDVLAGCVTYHLKQHLSSSVQFNKSKTAVADYLAQKLGKHTLAGEWHVSHPVDFGVKAL